MSKKSQKLDTLGNLYLKNRKKQLFLLKTMIFFFRRILFFALQRLVFVPFALGIVTPWGRDDRLGERSEYSPTLA